MDNLSTAIIAVHRPVNGYGWRHPVGVVRSVRIYTEMLDWARVRNCFTPDVPTREAVNPDCT